MTRKTTRKTQETSQDRTRAKPVSDIKPRSEMKPRSANAPRLDKARDMQDVVREAADETGDRNRDLAHGDGGTIGLPTGPADLSKDD